MQRFPDESANLFEAYDRAAIFVTIFRAAKARLTLAQSKFIWTICTHRGYSDCDFAPRLIGGRLLNI
jgi:hypothetical protein